MNTYQWLSLLPSCVLASVAVAAFVRSMRKEKEERSSKKGE